jgi:hypothetical protein
VIRALELSCAGAIENRTDWYKARRMLANVNYRVVVQLAKENESHPDMAKYLLPAVEGFIQSIVLAPKEVEREIEREIERERERERESCECCF